MNISEKTKEGMQPFVKNHCSKIRKVVRQLGFDKLDILSPREREIIELRLQNITMEEIGERIGIPRPNVYRTQKRALNKMKIRKEEEQLMW
jgi:RNA polymerase sigma factor (sigma-70 family)